MTIKSGEYFRKIMAEGEYDSIPVLDTLNEIAEFACKKYADNTVFVSSGLTYSELGKCVRRIVTFLRKQNFRPGAHIALYMNNSDEYVEIFLAVICSGLVAVPVNPKLPDISEIIRKYDIDAVICDDIEKCGREKYICRNDCFSENEESDFQSVRPEDTAVIMFSSGTLSAPKGIVLSHKAMATGSRYGCYSNGKSLNIRYFNVLPFSHIFGIVRSMLSVIYTGSSMYNAKSVMELFTRLPEINPDIMIMVPAMAELLLGLVKKAGRQALGTQLKTIICGGAFTPPSLIFKMKEAGVTVCPGYGLTETANLVSGNGNMFERPDSAGMIYPGIDFKTENGELLVRGDNIMTEYYGDPDATAAAFSDGWLKTGDLARVNGDGFLYILGRCKNVIVTSDGENIFPDVLETAIYGIEGVKENIVYSKKNKFGSCILCCEIYPEQEDSYTEEYFRNKIYEYNNTLQPFERISDIIIRNRPFERTANLKIIRPEVKQ